MERHNHIGVVFTDALLTATKSKEVKKFSAIHRKIRETLQWEHLDKSEGFYQVNGSLAQALYKRCFIQISTTLVVKRLFEDIRFDEDRFGTEDIDLWIRLAQKTEFGYLDVPTTLYHHSLSSLSSRSISRINEMIKYHISVLSHPSYEGLQETALGNLYHAFLSAIIYYSELHRPDKAFAVFRQSLTYGFDPKLLLASIMSVMGPLPFQLYHSWSKRRIE